MEQMLTGFRRLVTLAFFCCWGLISLPAQSGPVVPFRHLATTDDGALLYFSSPLPVAGDEVGTFKIFEFSTSGALRVIAQQQRIDTAYWTNNYDLGWPSVSGDGSVVAYTGEAYCFGPQSQCALQEIYSDGTFQGNVILGDGTVLFISWGQVRVSHNGQFALFVGSSPDITVSDLLTGAVSIIHADQSRPSELRSHVATGRSVASDGTSVLVGTRSVAEPVCCTFQPEIQLGRDGTIQRFLAQGYPTSAVIDDGATTVAYETHTLLPDQSLGPGRIFLLDLSSGSEMAIAENASHPYLTNDGTLLQYLAPDANGTIQAWTVLRDGTNPRQLTFDSSGTVEAVISGDGTVAYAITNSMRLVQIDVSSGNVIDLTTSIVASISAEVNHPS